VSHISAVPRPCTDITAMPHLSPHPSGAPTCLTPPLAPARPLLPLPRAIRSRCTTCRPTQGRQYRQLQQLRQLRPLSTLSPRMHWQNRQPHLLPCRPKFRFRQERQPQLLVPASRKPQYRQERQPPLLAPHVRMHTNRPNRQLAPLPPALRLRANRQERQLPAIGIAAPIANFGKYGNRYSLMTSMCDNVRQRAATTGNCPFCPFEYTPPEHTRPRPSLTLLHDHRFRQNRQLPATTSHPKPDLRHKRQPPPSRFRHLAAPCGTLRQLPSFALRDSVPSGFAAAFMPGACLIIYVAHRNPGRPGGLRRPVSA
jgi:hypothetical protein